MARKIVRRPTPAPKAFRTGSGRTGSRDNSACTSPTYNVTLGSVEHTRPTPSPVPLEDLLLRQPTPRPPQHYTALPELGRRFNQQAPDILPRERDVATESMIKITKLGPRKSDCTGITTTPIREQNVKRGTVGLLGRVTPIPRPRLMGAAPRNNIFLDDHNRGRERAAKRLLKDVMFSEPEVNMPLTKDEQVMMNPYWEKSVYVPFLEAMNEQEKPVHMPGATRYGPRPPTPGPRVKIGHGGPCRFPHHNVCDEARHLIEERERRLQNRHTVPDNIILRAYSPLVTEQSRTVPIKQEQPMPDCEGYTNNLVWYIPSDGPTAAGQQQP